MGKLLKLIQNEWMKLWHQKSTWVMLIILIVVIIGFGGLNKYYSNTDDRDWRTVVEEELKMDKESLAQEDIDADYASYLQDNIAIAEYRLAENIAPQKGESFASFMSFGVDLFMFVTLFTVIIAASIVSSEYSTGTIKMLLTRPVSRAKILTSKLLTSFLYGFFLIAVSLAMTAIVGLVLFGQESGVQLTMVDGIIKEVDTWGDLFEKAYLSLGNFTMSILFAFLIGSVFRSSALAIGLTMFLSFSGSLVVMLLSKYWFAKYIWLAHDLIQYQTGYFMIEGITMPFSLAILAVYAIIFLIISYWSFMKRDVTA
ncbi:ABC transporter permease subunit [Solibacillus sp. CAU 1738]|uniref:ABC transporter permease subunit n=1 Tax=Solibacillus sp. CAU 1738 TaxID=3140363 RepID=UPI00325FECA8